MVWWWLLACGGGGGLVPEEGAPMVRWVLSDDQPVVSTAGDWATYRNDYNAAQNYWYSDATVGQVRWDGYAVAAGAQATMSEYPAFDDEGRLVVVVDGVLNVTDTAGLPYARVDLGVTAVPAIGVDGALYLGAGPEIVAIDASGLELWRVPVGGQTTGRAALAADGTVLLLGSTDAGWELYAARDGELLWTAPIGTPTSWPALTPDGSVLVGTYNGADFASAAPGDLFLEAYDGASGALLWQYAAGGIVSAPIVWPDGQIGALVTGVTGATVSETALPEGSGRDWLVAVDDGGSEAWRADELPVPLFPAVLDDDGNAWLSCGGEICIVSDRGREVDRFTVWDWQPVGAPVLWEGWILATLDGWLLKIQLPDPDITTATAGWAREGGNARGSGREAGQ